MLEHRRVSWGKWLGGLVALGLVAAWAHWYAGQAPPGQGQRPGGPQQRRALVGVSPAKRENVNVHLVGLGSVVAEKTVTVKSRVDGELVEVLFTEGQFVKKGDLLARIDPRPFAVQLSQAQGQLARDQALLDNARLDHRRYKGLSENDLIARQQFDTQTSLVRQYEGAVKADQSQVDNANLQLTYSRITAPVSGRVGLRLVDPGNMVRQTDAAGLVVITQVEPISVVFSLAEDSLPQVLAKVRAGERLQVEAFDREQKRLLATGELSTIDNQIDPATGTVKLKARFANQDMALFPNQFVNARLLANVLQNAVTVPAQAVQRGPQGAFVYVLAPDKTVSFRPVETGQTAEGVTVVAKGLAAGELVVVEGGDRLRDKAPVDVRESAPASGKAADTPQPAPAPGKAADTPQPASASGKAAGNPQAAAPGKAADTPQAAAAPGKAADTPQAAAAPGKGGGPGAEAGAAPDAQAVKTKDAPAATDAAASKRPEAAPGKEAGK